MHHPPREADILLNILLFSRLMSYSTRPLAVLDVRCRALSSIRLSSPALTLEISYTPNRRRVTGRLLRLYIRALPTPHKHLPVPPGFSSFGYH
jgi:hypothetical protein